MVAILKQFLNFFNSMVTMAMAAILKMHYYTSQGIIPLKFHYYQITNIFRTFMVTMGTVAILKEMLFF
jgi:hypothetical protein